MTRADAGRCAFALMGSLVLVLAARPAGAEGEPANEAEAIRRGEEIVAQIDAAQSALGERMMVVRMRLVEASGQVRERRVRTLLKGESKRLIRFLAPADQRGLEVLVESPELMYVYTPDSGRIRRLGMHFEQQGFLGSDITTDDLTRTRMGPVYTARLLSQRGDEATIELRPRAKGSDLSKVVAVANLRYRLFQTLDYYDDKGQRWKRRSSTNFVETGMSKRTWWPKSVMYVDFKRNHATELLVEEFHTELGVPDSVFSVRSLGKADWTGGGGKH